MRAVSAPNDVTEEATCPEIVRRALSNEAKKIAGASDTTTERSSPPNA
jgi:hypothetical protein